VLLKKTQIQTKPNTPLLTMTTPNRRNIGNDNTIDVPATASTVNRRPGFVLKKQYWIPGLLFLLLLIAMVRSHFLSNKKPKTASPAPQVSASEAQQLRKENEGLKKDFDELKKVLATRQAEAAPLAPPVAEKPAPVAQTSPKGDYEVDASEQSVKVEFVPYDPKRHTAQKVQPYQSGITMHTFKDGDEPPAFSVRETPERAKTRNGMVMVRPVYVKPGIPLIARDGEAKPRLKDSSLTPYPLNVWNEETQEYRAIWFAK
jgi:hypothetical protein